MSYALTLLAVLAAGGSLVSLMRFATGHRVVDVPLAWFVGSGWFGLSALVSRFLLGIPFSRMALLLIAGGPVLAWVGTMRRRSREAVAGVGALRWFPARSWLWAPLAGYVLLVVAGAIMHGVNTPTHTDDGVRVRAFTPVLAFRDEWDPDARGLLVLAGAVPTFVPAIGWVASGTVDHFHVNYVVLTDLVALVVLVVGLGAARGSPERGWASALGIVSIPLFVYHCTSTYQDAVLAMFVGAAFLFVMEYERGRDPSDLARALLVLVPAAMVKREGEWVAASLSVLVLALAVWDHSRGASAPRTRLAVLAAIPWAALFVAKVAAVGISSASPVTEILAARIQGGAVGGAAAPGHLYGEASRAFVRAVFRSGNAGMVYWVLLATVLLRARALTRSRLGRPLAVVMVLFAEAAISSIWLIPEFTVNGTTVHRALLVASVPAALWAAAALVESAVPSQAHDPVPPGKGCATAHGATPEDPV